MEFEDAVVKQRPKCMSSSALTELNESRVQSRVEHRLTELEGWYFVLVCFDITSVSFGLVIAFSLGGV